MHDDMHHQETLMESGVGNGLGGDDTEHQQ